MTMNSRMRLSPKLDSLAGHQLGQLHQRPSVRPAQEVGQGRWQDPAWIGDSSPERVRPLLVVSSSSSRVCATRPTLDELASSLLVQSINQSINQPINQPTDRKYMKVAHQNHSRQRALLSLLSTAQGVRRGKYPPSASWQRTANYRQSEVSEKLRARTSDPHCCQSKLGGAAECTAIVVRARR